MAKMNDSMDITDATTGTQPIPSYRPDAKARRYDRQLRLWASAGQRSLEAARVLLIGCDATGCQALKNLVLPGIAQFTILSSHKVEPRDIATNFFLHPDSMGLNIAEEAVKLLKELNPAVGGVALDKDPESLLQSDPDFFASFTIIIASNVEPKLELSLAESLWKASEKVGGPDVPLICIRNSGFIGRIEIQLREHCVSDTHPEQTHTLRVDQPFPELETMARSLDFESMDSMEHSHIPWVVILARAVCLWKDEHGGNLPNSDSDEERAAFKEMIKSWRHKADEENFDEALRAAYQGFTKSELDPNLAQLFEDSAVVNISENSKNLHILLNALKQFTTTRLPPISPTLPDMHSSTSSYVALQNLYRARFNQDFAEFKQILADTLARIGLPEDAIPGDEVESFARNSGGVQVIKGQPLKDSKEFKGSCLEIYNDQFSADIEERPIHLGMHLALLAAERFHSVTGRWPGSTETTDLSDENSQVEEIALTLLKTAMDVQEVGTEVADSIAEVNRGGFSTLPTTAAFLGGVVAQEAIKLVTNQYMPLDNTVIVDLVRSSMEKYKF